MKSGTITCKCGQQFYFETNSDTITCIKCKKIHNITTYPEKVEEPVSEGDELDGVTV